MSFIYLIFFLFLTSTFPAYSASTWTCLKKVDTINVLMRARILLD
jgi:hypothetical protein